MLWLKGCVTSIAQQVALVLHCTLVPECDQPYDQQRYGKGKQHHNKTELQAGHAVGDQKTFWSASCRIAQGTFSKGLGTELQEQSYKDRSMSHWGFQDKNNLGFIGHDLSVAG